MCSLTEPGSQRRTHAAAASAASAAAASATAASGAAPATSTPAPADTLAAAPSPSFSPLPAEGGFASVFFTKDGKRPQAEISLSLFAEKTFVMPCWALHRCTRSHLGGRGGGPARQ